MTQPLITSSISNIPLRDPITADPNSVVSSNSWATWFQKLVDNLNGFIKVYNSLVNAFNNLYDYAGFTVQTDQTSSRSLGVAYKNSGSFAMIVFATVADSSPGNGGTLSILTDSSNPPTTAIQTQTIESEIINFAVRSVSAMVLPGNYVEVTYSGTGTLSTWVETK